MATKSTGTIKTAPTFANAIKQGISTVATALPPNLWSGTPIRNALSIGVAHADYTPPAPAPAPQKVFTPVPSPLNPNYNPNAGGNYNTPSSIPTNNNSNNGLQAGIDQINRGGDAGSAQIEADYNQAMSMLNNAQSDLTNQGQQASATLDTGLADTTNQIGNEQTTATNATNASLATGEQGAKTAMQTARDVFRQTQQNNQSQLSALGISSSSVQEALAEKLGVDTARRIANVGDSLQTVRQNATDELGRIKTYYQGQITNATKHVEDLKAQIQNSLIQGLNQINSARGQAASDKAAARSSLLNQVQNQIGSLVSQQQQFQQSLDAWAQQKTAALTPIAQDPNYISKLIATANTFNQQFNPQGFQFAPQVNVNAQGTMTGQIAPQATKVDPFQQYLQQNGIAPVQ